MFGFVGAHFEMLVLIGMGTFALVLGSISIGDALKH